MLKAMDKACTMSSMDLSAELRVLVYEAFFAIILSKPSRRRTAILRVSKQVYKEAQPIFQTLYTAYLDVTCSNHLQIFDKCDLLRDHKSMNVQGRTIRLPRGRKWIQFYTNPPGDVRALSTLLSPIRDHDIETLHVKLVTSHYPPNTKSPIETLESFVRAIVANSRSLKRLTVVMTLDHANSRKPTKYGPELERDMLFQALLPFAEISGDVALDIEGLSDEVYERLRLSSDRWAIMITRKAKERTSRYHTRHAQDN